VETSSRQTWIPYTVLAVLTVLFLYPFVCQFVDLPDSGICLYGADLVNHGALQGRDFVEPQGPGEFWLLALAFRLFGTTLRTAHWELIVTGVATALLALYLSRKLGASGLMASLFVVTMGVPLLPINSPHYGGNLFALAALAVFLAGWERADWRWIAGAGALCGLASWMIQQKGVYLVSAMAISLAWTLRKKALAPIAILLATCAAVIVVPYAYAASQHALADLLYANFIWPMSAYSDFNKVPYGFPIWRNMWTYVANAAIRHDNLIRAIGEDLVMMLPLVAVALMPLLVPMAARLSSSRWLGKPLLPVWLCAYALWFSELHRMDFGHLRYGAMLLGILFFSICEAGGNVWLRRAAFGLTACVVIAGVANIALNIQEGHIMQTRRGPVRVSNEASSQALAYLEAHTQRGEDVFVYPYQSIYYFAEDLHNPTRYSSLLYHFASEDQFREATRALEDKRVRLVMWDKLLSGPGLSQMFPSYHHPDPNQQIMEPYLAAHYRTVDDLGRFKVLERVR
jgi:hypothetical protein